MPDKPVKDDLEDLDFKFIDPTNYEDADAPDVSAARKQALLNEALNVARQSWLTKIAAANDQARADAIVIPDPPVAASAEEDDPEDPYAEERAKKERLEMAVEQQLDQADELDKSFARKKNRLKAANVTIAPSDIKTAKKAFLLGQTDQQGQAQGGYLAQLEQEFINHRQKRRRANAALAMTGALALNEQEAAQMQQQVDESTEAMTVLKALIQTYRQEAINLGASLPAKAGSPAPIGETNNRAARRAKSESKTKTNRARLASVPTASDDKE